VIGLKCKAGLNIFFISHGNAWLYVAHSLLSFIYYTYYIVQLFLIYYTLYILREIVIIFWYTDISIGYITKCLWLCKWLFFILLSQGQNIHLKRPGAAPLWQAICIPSIIRDTNENTFDNRGTFSEQLVEQFLLADISMDSSAVYSPAS
jgi:hypothetical protein